MRVVNGYPLRRCRSGAGLWIGTRALKGIGGGTTLPVTITLLARAAGRERIGRAITTIGLVGQLGPLFAGLLITSVCRQ